MLKDRLLELFKEYDQDIQQVIDDVLALEQEYISMERPRVKDQIKQIIEQVVKDET